MLAFITGLATAQSTSQLNGSVSDPSGASVAGAQITLADSATGLQRSTTSNSSGLFQFLDVPPGKYQLRASAKGFAPFLVSDVTLVVNTPSTVNIKFQVAGIAESVTVQDQAPLINRTDASLGNTVEQDQIAQLPIPDRNVVALLSLQPGVAYLGNQSQDLQDTDTRSGAVNGMRSDQSNVTLDSIEVNDQNKGYAFTSVLNIPPDSVQEFRVTTANSNADSGYSSGAQVALVTKSGTNDFHGSVYEYNRNTAFSANDWFLKQSQLQNGQPNKAPELIRNVFGATVSGPIRRNRAFFFLNYEGRRDAEGTSVLRTVPSASLRAGNLFYRCQTASQCPGGTVSGIAGVPQGFYALGPSQIQGMDGISEDPAVLSLLQQYPSANESAGDGINTLGFRFAPPAHRSFNTYITRLDYRITSSGSESLFLRGETQNFKQPGDPQFSGQAPATTGLDDSKGLTVGLTSLISPRLINEFHWGFIRQGVDSAGFSHNPGVFLSGLDDLMPFTRTTTAFVPVNQFSENLNWTHGRHTLQFGTDLFLIRNDHTSDANSYSDVQTNPVYLNTGGIAGTSSPLDPFNNGYPAVDSNFGPNYDQTIAILLGIFAEGDGVYNFARNGQALPQGKPVNRRYAFNDYEFFGQDTFHITPRLTVTYGLRWLLEAPPYETNGYQVAPCIENASGGCTNQNAADWFAKSAQLAAQGQPANNAGEIGFQLGGAVNHGPGLWNWDRRDFSPRIAVAWAPDTGEGWVSKILGRKDQFSIRAGYSIVYDHFGIPIVNTFDQKGSFGLSTDLGNPAGVISPSNAPTFTCLIPGSAGQSCLPPACPNLNNPGCLFGPAPAGGFPYTPSNSAFAINWGLDQSAKTPYSHMFNFSVSRQITSHSSLQVAYVGTIGRRLPLQVDLGMPINLIDTASKTKYFQAATMLSKAAANGTSISQLQSIPFFENVFPGWASVTASQLNSQTLDCATQNGLGILPAAHSATQAIYELWNCYPHNETFSLFQLDLPSSITQVSVPNSKFGPYAFFHDQFSSLYAWRNIGTSDYNAMQVTYNVRWGANLEGQFNYTFSKSFDEASAAERIGPYEGTGGTGNDLNGGGIVINSWDPLALRGLSDFNAFHQMNANLVYHLPLGRGQMLAPNAGRLLDTLIGGWNLSTIFRRTSGFPTTVDNCPCWATNWNIEGDAMPNGPAPVARTTKHAMVNGVDIGPDMFANPVAAENAFRPEWPGESGVRNTVIGDGMFNVDTGVSKDFAISEHKRVEFSWQAFNAFNSVRFDVRGPVGSSSQPSLSDDPTQFGKYHSTLTAPRFMQFALRFEF
ncbi:MAG TPA: carboxypeptidase regulatory-like domain-containing protein [Terriglobales bacterium]